MKSSTKTLMVMALVMFSFASVMHATSINCALTPSASACAPTLAIALQVGNGPSQTVSMASTPTFTSGSWNASFSPQALSGFLFSGAQVYANSDPFVGFSIGGVNNTNAIATVSFDFTTPYVGGPYVFVQSVYGDVLIDTNFTGTSTMHPVGSTYIMNTYDTGNLINQVGLGKGCTTPAHVFVCTSPDIGGIGPLNYTSLASGTLEVKGSFTLTPGAQYTITGRSELLPAPEPGTLGLLGSGLLGLAGFARRRMSN